MSANQNKKDRFVKALAYIWVTFGVMFWVLYLGADVLAVGDVVGLGTQPRAEAFVPARGRATTPCVAVNSISLACLRVRYTPSPWGVREDKRTKSRALHALGFDFTVVVHVRVRGHPGFELLVRQLEALAGVGDPRLGLLLLRLKRLGTAAHASGARVCWSVPQWHRGTQPPHVAIMYVPCACSTLSL